MRFKEFISEETTFDSLEQAVRVVRANCKPWLKAANGQMIFRGILGAPETAMFSKHPENRKPKDSHRTPYFNFLFNTGIELVWGQPLIREKALFVSGSTSQAAVYGRIFVVFPKGSFTYLSSEFVHDSYEESNNFVSTIAGHLKQNVSHMYVKAALSYLSKRFTAPQFAEGIDSAEVKSAFDNGGESANISYDDLKTAIFKTFSEFYFTGSHGTIGAAIRSKDEIMLTKTEGYYSIPLSWFMAEMAKRGIDHHGVDTDNKAVDDFVADYMYGDLE